MQFHPQEDVDGQGGGGDSELFPRRLTLELVDQAMAGQQKREAWQPWVLGLGLAALALGLPSERLWGNLGLLPLGDAGHVTAWHTWAGGLAQLCGLRVEQLWYLLSAIGFGLSAPALVVALTRIGFERRVALMSSGLLLLSPLAWLGSRVPGEFGMAILLATLTMALCFDRARPRWVRLFALGPACLHPCGLLLLPCVLWGAGLAQVNARAAGQRTGARGSPVVPVLLGTATLALAGFSWMGAGSRDPLRFLWLRLTAEGGSGPGIMLMWALAVPLGLGVGSLGIWHLFAGRRAEEESPPPTWLLLWCALAAIPALTGTPLARPALSWLLPAAAVGLADWMAGRETEERLVKASWLLAGVQLLLITVLTFAFSTTDPGKEWRASARQLLEPQDLLLSTEELQVYLARERWGLETLHLAGAFLRMDSGAWSERIAPALEEAARTGRRIVISGRADQLQQEVRGQLVARGALRLSQGQLVPLE